jgi:hypothetical protein
MARGAPVLLGVLLVVALGLAFAVSLLPAEWSTPLPGIPFGPGPGGPPPFVSGTPQPSETPTLTPLPGGRRGSPSGPFDGRTRIGFFSFERTNLGSFGGRVADLILLLAGGVLTLFLLPRRLGCIAAALRGGGLSVIRLALVGLAGYIILGALSVLAASTILGIAAGFFLIAVIYGITVVGLAAVSLPLGRWVARRAGLPRQSPLVDLLAGLLVVFILSTLPFLGPAAVVVLAIIGCGAILQTRAGSDEGWDFDLPEVLY